MTDELRPTPSRGVPIELDRPRYLRYSLATRRKMRAELGDASLLKADGGDEKLPQLLLYGLLEDDPALTVEQLEDMIDLENLPRVLEAVLKAMGGGKVIAANVDPQLPAPAPALVVDAPPQ